MVLAAESDDIDENVAYNYYASLSGRVGAHQWCVISFLIMRVSDVIILGVYWTGSNWYWVL
jgi:hypothetical protein